MKSPISLQFVAAGAASYFKYELGRFKPVRTSQSPSWEGRDDSLTAQDIAIPITDKKYWEGRWVFCPLTLRNEGGETLELPIAVAAVSRERRVVSTALTGMDGTVKEYINEGDWAVNLVVGLQCMRGGVMVDEYPAEELKALRGFLEEKAALEVHSEFLALWDITKVVVKSWSLTQATESNYQEVSITAVSDEDYELTSQEY